MADRYGLLGAVAEFYSRKTLADSLHKSDSGVIFPFMRIDGKIWWFLVAVLVAAAAGIAVGSGGLLPLHAPFAEWTRAQQVVLSYRCWRVLTAFAVGGALATAGMAYQAVLRNPLAEPYILGVSGGASLGAALALWLGIGAGWVFGVPVAAFGGALAALGLVWTVAGGRRNEFSQNILLGGVIVSALCSSILMFIISVMGATKLNSITWWMLGNLSGQNHQVVTFAAAAGVVGTGLLWLFGREANALALGGEMAHGFGVSPERTGKILLLTASFLAAAAVSAAGIIGFVGLVVPHMLRRLFGVDHRRLFPLALLAGGAFLVVCDTAARLISPVRELPVGVITAVIGAPFFLWLLHRQRQGDV